MLQVQAETGQAAAEFEAGERDLVEHDREQAPECDLERAMVKQRDAGERQPEQDEIDRDAEHHDGLAADRRRGERRRDEEREAKRERADDLDDAPSRSPPSCPPSIVEASGRPARV